MRRAERPPTDPRRGFTLIEVMIALVLGVITISGARAVSGVLSDHAERLAVADAAAAERVNGARLLRRLVRDTEAGRDAAATFAGSATEAGFGTWCRVPAGWSERCAATLTLEPDSMSGETLLRVSLSTGEGLVLGRFTPPVRLAYLEDAAHGGAWSAVWGPATAAPLAIGVFSTDAPLILPTRSAP
jgi:prepilin-type N-terminal cleavage/methylation domain-containing protein